MQVTLLHNPTAGHDGKASQAILKALRRAGYDPVYQSVKDNAFPHVLEEPGDLVVVAGGDGTVRKAVTHLVDRDVPLVVLPMGTANNIAMRLGMREAPETIIASLDTARRQRFDVGKVRGPWGEQFFVEGVGFGLFPEMMSVLSAQKKQAHRTFESPQDELNHDRRILAETLQNFPARAWQVTLDGEDHSGRYLLLEALNAGAFGPNLQLAPAANSGDGVLDIVLLPEEERGRLIGYLERCLAGEEEPFDGAVRPCRSVRIAWEGTRLHVDDILYPEGPDDTTTPGVIEVSVGEHSVEFLVPGAAEDTWGDRHARRSPHPDIPSPS